MSQVRKFQLRKSVVFLKISLFSVGKVGLLLLPVVVDVLDVVMLGTKSPVGRFRNPLKIKHFQDLRLSKVANSVLLVCHSSSDMIKYNWLFEKVN